MATSNQTLPPDFPWRRGMTARHDCETFLVLGATVDMEKLAVLDRLDRVRLLRSADCTPDPNDGATLGALLAAVQTAYDNPHLTIQYAGTITKVGEPWPPGPWALVSASRCVTIQVGDYAETKLELLLAAWNARPVKP